MLAGAAAGTYDRGMAERKTLVRRLAIAFLILEALGTHLWWGLMLLRPEARGPFAIPGAPDAALLAFLVPDLVLYAGAAAVAALGLFLSRPWGWPALLLHTGAGVYAALACLSASLLTGGAWLGTALMAPALVVLPVLAYLLRPGGAR